MTNTIERGEITSRENAKEAEVIQQSKELIAVKRRFRNVNIVKHVAGPFEKYRTLLSHLRS
jgi:hypothetical protein